MAALALLMVAAVTALLLTRPTGAVAAAAVTDGLVAGEGASVLVVGQGETVWDLVVPHTPAGAHPSAWVAQVVAHNGLDATAVQPGTVLRLPPSWASPRTAGLIR